MDKLSVSLLQQAGRERKCKSTRVCMCATEYRADYVSKAESTSPSSGRRRYHSYICWPPAGHADGAASQTASICSAGKTLYASLFHHFIFQLYYKCTHVSLPYRRHALCRYMFSTLL